jgi:hypothetical protein
VGSSAVVRAAGTDPKPTLGGTGDVGPVTVTDGILDPGSVSTFTGTLTVHGPLSFQTGSGPAESRTFHVDLSPVLGFFSAAADQVKVLGTVDLGKGITQLDIAPRVTPSQGQTFVIIDNDGTDAVIGAFAGLPRDGSTLKTPGGAIYAINYHAGDGNDVAVTYIDTPTKITDVSITPVIDEGDRAVFTGRLTDPDAADVHHLTLVVDWDDGSPLRAVHPGTGPFRLTHHYREAGAYTVTFSWTDGRGVVRSDSRTVTVVEGDTSHGRGKDQDEGDRDDDPAASDAVFADAVLLADLLREGHGH